VDETTRRLRERTGLDVVGCYAFGSGPAQADELLAFVTRGTKRATVGALVELAELDDPLPAVGQLWGLLDGTGEPRFVAETVDVQPGELDDVTPAFAWDEGEDDRTFESWWDGHRTWASQLGRSEDEPFEVLFERFRIVWPEPDRTGWLADGVREARYHERRDLRRAYERHRGGVEVVAADERWELDALPALVLERAGRVLGVLPFRPRPAGEVLTFGVTLWPGAPRAASAAADEELAARLRRGLEALGERHGWRRTIGS
jgi:uncharacterized protein YhfF